MEALIGVVLGVIRVSAAVWIAVRYTIVSWGARSLWRLRNDALAREALIGLVLAALGIAATAWITYGQNQLSAAIAQGQAQLSVDLETASEIRENVQFVRQVVIDNAAEKPFRALNLSGASLSGLDLACEDLKSYPPSGCAVFIGADLAGADLFGVDLAGANLASTWLAGAHLTLANLTGADLHYAWLAGADLAGADLTDAVLSGANLSDANLSGGGVVTDTNLTRVCYNRTTAWPDGFTPPPPTCPNNGAYPP